MGRARAILFSGMARSEDAVCAGGDRSGLGDHAAVVEHADLHGRVQLFSESAVGRLALSHFRPRCDPALDIFCEQFAAEHLECGHGGGADQEGIFSAADHSDLRHVRQPRGL